MLKIEKVFTAKGSIKFIFYAYTPYQLLLMLYFGYKLKNIYKDNGYFVLIHHELLNKTIAYFNVEMWDKVICIYGNQKLEVRSFLKHPISWFVERKAITEQVKKVFKEVKEANFIFFSSGDAILVQEIVKKYRNAIVVYIGEGVASYSSEYRKQFKRVAVLKKKIKEIKLEIIGKIFGFYLGTGDRIAGNDEVNIIIDRNTSALSEYFSRNRLIYEINNNEIADSFINLLREGIDFENYLKKVKSPSMLFFSQRLSEDGFLDRQEEVEFYKKLSIYLDEYGINLYIKPHPREANEKLMELKKYANVLIELKEFPAEVLVEYLKVDILGTIGSSVLLMLYERKIAKKYVIFDRIFFKEQKNLFSYINFEDILKIENDFFVPEKFNDIENIVKEIL